MDKVLGVGLVRGGGLTSPSTQHEWKTAPFWI